jgi:DNA-binding LacI/PurR family transcriptional regulator
VAALAGVSASTASLAFSGSGPVSEATRAKVLAAAAALDYAGPDPRAQSLRRGRSGVVGVVIEDRLRDAFRDPMNIAMLDGLADEAGALGAGLLLLTDTGDGAGSIDTAPMDAVVLVGCSTRLDRAVAVLRRRRIPLVAVEAQPMDGVLDIALDNREASGLAAAHLHELGHERVAVVALPLDAARAAGPLSADWESIGTAFVALERLRGVREVYPGLSGWVAGGSTIEEGRLAGLALLGGVDSCVDLTTAGGGAAAAPGPADASDQAGVPGGAALSGPAASDGAGRPLRPTAIVAQSDLLAVGVIRAAEELGLAVPEDVSVVGFDGARIDGVEPYDLTTLVQPAVEKGRAAGRAVVEMLTGGHPRSVRFSSVFHAGNTTAPVPTARA